MDITTAPPEEYVAWLRSIGVAPQDIAERLAHDALRAMASQLDKMGNLGEFEILKADMDAALADDALHRTLS